MSDPSSVPCVLVVADRDRVGELVSALSELPGVEVMVSAGNDETIELFVERRPAVVVVTASLVHGDARALIATLRARVPRAKVAVVVVGDDAGPVRTALDALDLAPDRFVTRPLSARALRFAVTGGIDAVRIARAASAAPAMLPAAFSMAPARMDTQPGATPPPRRPSRSSITPISVTPISVTPISVTPISVTPIAATPIAATPIAATPIAATPIAVEPVSAVTAVPVAVGESAGSGGAREAMRARWEALADAMSSDDDEDTEDAPLRPPLVIKPRRRQGEPGEEATAPAVYKPGSTDEIAPIREPTLILREAAPPPLASAAADPPAASRTSTGDGRVVVAARTSSEELWSEPMSIPALADRDLRAETEPPIHADAEEIDAAIDAAFEPEFGASSPRQGAAADPGPGSDLDAFPEDLVADVQPHGGGLLESPDPGDGRGVGGEQPRDFARELRAKMSMMAQRLFRGGEAAASSADHRPPHDHRAEIDLAALGAEPRLGGIHGLEGRSVGAAVVPSAPRELRTSPGSWDTQVRERGLPDRGALVRGISDAAMLLAKMFAQGSTGRVVFRRDEVETVVYFDRGRPVFASSNEPRDRMGELLLREGKITASQYERCQVVVAESGRRMGEILVDFGYLKRRELLPAVRRHVEDLVYSLFGWDRGNYAISVDSEPSSERIRLSRHPAALILEGIRRKLDRTSLERLVGPPSTVIEVQDRERLGGIVHIGDLAPEERSALAAFDGQADLGQVAQVVGGDLADVLPLAWALCALGLATARRADAEAPDESTALVGETDLAIDRERVRARWQLVTEADYFALLGVRRDATGFEIRRAYQSARRDFAADCFPSDLRRELARELDDIAHVLDEAFRVLRDDRLRQTYLANLIDS